MWQADLGNGKYRNPILYADYSDPDAIRVGEDYFMIASSFCNAPAAADFTFKRFGQLESSQLCHWTSLPEFLLPTIRFMAAGYGHRQSGIMREPITIPVIPMPDEGIYMYNDKRPVWQSGASR